MSDFVRANGHIWREIDNEQDWDGEDLTGSWRCVVCGAWSGWVSGEELAAGDGDNGRPCVRLAYTGEWKKLSEHEPPEQSDAEWELRFGEVIVYGEVSRLYDNASGFHMVLTSADLSRRPDGVWVFDMGDIAYEVRDPSRFWWMPFPDPPAEATT